MAYTNMCRLERLFQSNSEYNIHEIKKGLDTF